MAETERLLTVSINVSNNVPGAQVVARQSDNGVDIEVIQRQLADSIRRGGSSLTGEMESVYRVGRHSSAY